MYITFLRKLIFWSIFYSDVVSDMGQLRKLFRHSFFIISTHFAAAQTRWPSPIQVVLEDPIVEKTPGMQHHPGILLYSQIKFHYSSIFCTSAPSTLKIIIFYDKSALFPFIFLLGGSFFGCKKYLMWNSLIIQVNNANLIDNVVVLGFAKRFFRFA